MWRGIQKAIVQKRTRATEEGKGEKGGNEGRLEGEDVAGMRRGRQEVMKTQNGKMQALG